MDEQQQAAYVIGQAVSALIEMESMKVDNERCRRQGVSDAYEEGAFMALQEKYCISHNAVLSLFHG